MNRRTHYRQGPTFPPTDFMRWVRRRTEWAAKEAMVTRDAIRAIRWEWVSGLWCKDRDDDWCGLYGRVKFARKGVTVVINCATDDHIQDTAVHEYAHALLAPVEGLRQRGGDERAHTPAWAALYGDLYCRFIDLSSEGPQIPEGI